MRADTFTIGVIDAGSNAIRLLVGRRDPDGFVRSLANGREPLRLGTDVFADGRLSDETLEAAFQALGRLRAKAIRYGADHVFAIGTSALRSAENSDALILRAERELGLKLELISGEEEARLAWVAVDAVLNLDGRDALLVDIGGGSVELTIMSAGHVAEAATFPLGPVRLLSRLEVRGLGEAEAPALLEDYKGKVADLVAKGLGDRPIAVCAGVGGAVRALAELSGPGRRLTAGGGLTRHDLASALSELGPLTPQERAKKKKLPSDRADTILIAVTVLDWIMEEAGVSEMLVPGTGLKHGALLEKARMTVAARTKLWDDAIHGKKKR